MPTEREELEQLRAEFNTQLTPRQELEQLRSEFTPQYRSESEIPIESEMGLPFKPKPQQPEPTFGEKALGVGETALTLATGATTGALGYVHGLGQQLTEEIGSGEFGSAGSADRVERAAMEGAQSQTYTPKTKEGQKITQEVSGALEPLVAVAPMSSSLTAGVSRIRVPKGQTKAINRLLSKAAPSKEALREMADKVYSQLDGMGVTIKKKAYNSLVNDIKSTIKKAGFNRKIQPKIVGVIEELNRYAGKSPSVKELEVLRRVASKAAQSVDKSEAGMATTIIKKIDGFFENINKSTATGVNARKISPVLKNARDLWHRSIKNDKVLEMVNVAENYQSGFESGLRNQATNILRSTKKRKGFNAEEIKALQKISRGGSIENTLKFLSRFGVGEKQQITAIQALMGSGAGGYVGGPAGMVVLPIVGTVSGKLALKMTKNNAKYLGDLVRAGKNGKEVVGAYMKNTPKNKRNVAELTELLMRDDVNIKNIKPVSNVVKDALWLMEKYPKDQLVQILGLTSEILNEKQIQEIKP